LKKGRLPAIFCSEFRSPKHCAEPESTPTGRKAKIPSQILDSVERFQTDPIEATDGLEPHQSMCFPLSEPPARRFDLVSRAEPDTEYGVEISISGSPFGDDKGRQSSLSRTPIVRAVTLLLDHGDGLLVPIDCNPLTKFLRFGVNAFRT
jgi:hypothetical protein